MDAWKDYRVTLVGAGGMLASDLVDELERRGARVVALAETDCDVTDPVRCREAVAKAAGRVVINCAAYTDVNGSETHRELAMRVNGEGAGHVAAACREAGARCIYVSTDYVFDGRKEGPYLEDDDTGPLNAYGASKLEGEKQTARECADHVVARTSWLYGRHGRNFVTTILAAARAGKPLRVVNDQTGAPTWTRDLSRALADLAVAPVRGIVHATNSGACTWYGFTREILRQAGVTPVSLDPVSASEFPTPAARPANSRLSPRRLIEAGVTPLPPWDEALTGYLREIGEWRG